MTLGPRNSGYVMQLNSRLRLNKSADTKTATDTKLSWDGIFAQKKTPVRNSKCRFQMQY